MGASVRDVTLKHGLLAVLLLPLPWLADAAGLGRLAVLSSFGQPFRAEISLVSRQDELSSLSARVAPPDPDKPADLHGLAPADLRLSIKTQPSGQPYIEVASSRPVNELFVHFPVELTGGSTRLVRGYTALIDLPPLGPTPVSSAPVAAAAIQPAADAQGAASRRAIARPAASAPASGGQDVAKLSQDRASKAVAADASATPSLLSRIQALEEKSLLQKNALARLMERIAVLEKMGQVRPNVPEAKKPAAAAAPGRAGAEPPAPKAAVAKPETVTEAKREAVPVPERTDQPKGISPTEKPIARALPEKREARVARPAKSSPMDAITAERVYLALGGTVILLGGLAFWLRRRRQSQQVTPEDMLNKLLARDPAREDVQIKLLEFYAARQDKGSFQTAASSFRKLTDGQGEGWLRVAAMGYALDPGNPLYEAGKPAVPGASDANEEGRTG